MRWIALSIALLCLAAHAAEPKPFIFAWPLEEGALKPRGATTRGAPVTLDAAPGEAWRGPYRVSFDFLEVVRFDPALKPDAPYQSWGTEYVFVAGDRPDFIALQHILVMRVLREGGSGVSPIVSEPMVVRHWRQEWRVEPERAAGRRFAALRRARWQHGAGASTWISDETWRELEQGAGRFSMRAPSSAARCRRATSNSEKGSGPFLVKGA